MNLMISETALRLTPAARHDSVVVDIHATRECGLGQALVARSNRELIRKEAMA
jgi:hypothetical protein